MLHPQNLSAPSSKPIPPHFDSDSSNLYYKLHAQPSWAFRVKKADKQGHDGSTLSDVSVNDYYTKVWDREADDFIYDGKEDPGCEYICSSKLPLVSMIKMGKNAVRGMK